MVLYRVADNSFEHYEPHGSTFRGALENSKAMKERNKGIEIFKEWIKYWEEVGLIPIGARYIGTNEVCPIVRGFQSLEGAERRDNDLMKSVEIDAGKRGFCQMWSIFYLEMCLKYPTISGRELIERGLKEMTDMGPGKFARHIVAYTRDIIQAVDKSKIFTAPLEFNKTHLMKDIWTIINNKFKELVQLNNPHLATADTERVAKLREKERALEKRLDEIDARLAIKTKAGKVSPDERKALKAERVKVSLEFGEGIQRAKNALIEQAKAQGLPKPVF
jgi:hypothetical protein